MLKRQVNNASQFFDFEKLFVVLLLEKEIKYLNHSIENEDCTQNRKQPRKKRTEIKKFKEKLM